MKSAEHNSFGFKIGRWYVEGGRWGKTMEGWPSPQGSLGARLSVRLPNATAALPQARRADRVWPTAQAAGTRDRHKTLSPHRGGRGLCADANVDLGLSLLPGLRTFHPAPPPRLTPWAKICRRSAAPRIRLNPAPMPQGRGWTATAFSLAVVVRVRGSLRRQMNLWCPARFSH